MEKLKLTEPADFGILYDAVQQRSSDTQWQQTTCGVVTRELFIDYCLGKGFASLGFVCDDRQIGGLIFDGTAVHIEVLPAYHGRWGLLWPKALAWVLAQKDPFEVAIDAGNHKCLRFMDRNHFLRIAEDDAFVTYEVSSRAAPQFQARIERHARQGLAHR